MDIKKLVKLAMFKADVEGVMNLVEISGLSYNICSRALKGDKTLQLKYIEDILGSLGFLITADLTKA